MQTYQGSVLQIPTLVGHWFLMRVVYFGNKDTDPLTTCWQPHAQLRQHQFRHFAALVEFYLVPVDDRGRLADPVPLSSDAKKQQLPISAIFPDLAVCLWLLQFVERDSVVRLYADRECGAACSAVGANGRTLFDGESDHVAGMGSAVAKTAIDTIAAVDRRLQRGGFVSAGLVGLVGSRQPLQPWVRCGHDQYAGTAGGVTERKTAIHQSTRRAMADHADLCLRHYSSVCFHATDSLPTL